MPLQNRVDPFGNLFRTPARGTMMGNRGGPIHDERREIVSQFKSRRWIACVLEFRGRHRIVMTPNRYTELFFLDEAVAFAAGHRPCAECRRERYVAFQQAWSKDHPSARADDMDLILHPARIDRRGRQVTHEAPLDSLPDGTFIQLAKSPYLLWNGALHLWTPEGYATKRPRPVGAEVTVLTPQPIIQIFRRGYQTQVHDTVRSL